MYSRVPAWETAIKFSVVNCDVNNHGGIDMEESKIRLVGSSEICKILKISLRNLYNLIERNEIPFIRIGKGYRFDVDEVIAKFKEAKE